VGLEEVEGGRIYKGQRAGKTYGWGRLGRCGGPPAMQEVIDAEKRHRSKKGGREPGKIAQEKKEAVCWGGDSLRKRCDHAGGELWTKVGGLEKKEKLLKFPNTHRQAAKKLGQENSLRKKAKEKHQKQWKKEKALTTAGGVFGIRAHPERGGREKEKEKGVKRHREGDSCI